MLLRTADWLRGGKRQLRFPATTSTRLHSLRVISPLAVFAEMNKLLPDSPQQHVVFLFEERVFRENTP
jgi:hypothetical protein